MKFWIIQPNESLPDHDNPWKPWYDKVFKMLIYAENERDARIQAAYNGGVENPSDDFTRSPWMFEKYSTCEPLNSEGYGEESQVIITDFRAA